MSTRALIITTVLATLAFGTVSGCSFNAKGPRATDAHPDLATAAYWLRQPATDTVAHPDFDALWEACRGAARWRGFRVDRADYRAGVMVSYPLTSKQFFEVWRRDVSTLPDLAESSLATTRRIVRFQFARRDDGTFVCVPKVLVERYAQTERRITSVTQYRESFSGEIGVFGSRERDRGINVPVTYWYATGRDEVLERQLAEGVRARLPDDGAGEVASR